MSYDKDIEKAWLDVPLGFRNPPGRILQLDRIEQDTYVLHVRDAASGSVISSEYIDTTATLIAAITWEFLSVD